MSKFAEPMTRLIDELKKLPGVGSKSAQRLAFHILRSSEDDAEALAAAIRDVKANLRLCSICNNITDVDPCVYCSSATRNQKLVCVVEEPTNIAAVEKTQTFQWRLSRASWIAVAPPRYWPRATAHRQSAQQGSQETKSKKSSWPPIQPSKEKPPPPISRSNSSAKACA